MNISRRIILLLLIVIALGIVVTFLLLPHRTLKANLDFFIYDSNYNHQFEVNERLNFVLNDSITFKDKKMVWEFGNGDSIIQSKNTNYTYKKAGKYLVTLTIEDQLQIPKYIDVVKISQNNAIDSVPKIYGADKGYVNEELVFSSNASGATSWYWEFGETGTVDAYQEQVVYSYRTPGIYTVKLKTNTSKYPVSHTIKVLPAFQKVDSEPIDSLSIVGLDIKKRLQAIADAKVYQKSTFLNNVRYIEKAYICTQNTLPVVVVNGDMYNDFYSYCQGLHHLEGKGSKTIEINTVVVDTIHCIEKIKVTQSIIE